MPRLLRRDEYTVGWICALPVELAAAVAMLDEKHENLERSADDYDENLYYLGSIGGHNVAIVCLPAGRIGNNPAATVGIQMRTTFKRIRFGLMVGIGGGVPTKEDIRLGDVVVSHPYQTFAGVVQYDAGKATPSGFSRTGSLDSPPRVLLSAVNVVRANEFLGESKLSDHMSKLTRNPRFQRSNAGPDILFEAAYNHEGGQTCSQCNIDRQEVREPRNSDEVVVHYGTIASGNQVMRSAIERDRVSVELGGVLCFEMEAAGLMNSFPCLVVRGICDYADSHKNKKWQPYAAATAAAYVKEVLSVIPPADVVKTHTVEEMTIRSNEHAPTQNHHVPVSKYEYADQESGELAVLTQKLTVDQDPQDQGNNVPSLDVLQGVGREEFGSGRTLHYQNNFNEAKEPLRQAADNHGIILGKDHPDTYNSMHMLGCALMYENKYNEAERQLQQAVNGRKTTLGIDHLDTLESIHMLGRALAGQKKYSEAESRLQQAANGRKKSLGRDHPNTLDSIHMLGYVLYHQRKYSEAEEIFQQAVDGRERILGGDIPDTFESMHMLGLALADQKKYSEAESRLQQAADGRNKILGRDHLDTLESMHMLGRVLYYQKKSSEAEEIFQQAAYRRERTLGAEHPDTLQSIAMLGYTLFYLKNYSEAKKRLQQAVDGQEKILGRENPDTLRSIAMLGCTLSYQNNYSEAKTRLQQAVDGQERTIGTDHQDTLRSIYMLGCVLFYQDNYSEAERRLQQAIDRQERRLGESHLDTLDSKHQLGCVLFYQEKYGEAERLLQQAADGQEKMLGGDHPVTLKCIHMLGGALFYQKKYREAERRLQQAATGRERTLGRDHPDTRASISLLGQVYFC